MSDYSGLKYVIVKKENMVALVTLNRPDALNAISHEMHAELEELWPVLSADREINAIVLTGAGRAFSAGGDVKGMYETAKQLKPQQEPLSQIGPRRLINNMLECEQPIIAAINGDAMGLGATVALFSDITVAAETARIADPHVRVGIVAGDGGAVIWPHLIGANRAKEFLMRGNIINGAEAAKIGLVNYAVETAQVLPKAFELARELADGPTWAIRWTKQSVNKVLKQTANLVLDTSFALESLSFATRDHLEATTAFVEKRKPNFRG